MLVDLKVKNFVLIEELEINFGEGLNVLTGETGAGKSIIIGALDMLLGSRASTDIIRSGCQVAYIEAAYDPHNIEKINQILTEAGIEPDPEIILLSREIRLKGRNKSRINGQLATLSMIRRVSRYLVDIHGQHEHQLLLNRAEHRQLLDDFSGTSISEPLQQVNRLYERIKEIEDRLAEYQLDESEKARQLDMLGFQIKEIEEADLQEGELTDLKEEYNLLSNLEEIFSVTGEIAGSLSGEDYNQNSLLEQLGSFMKRLEAIKDFSDELAAFYQTIRDVFHQLQDLSFDMEKYNRDLEFDEARLQEIEQRLDLLQGLQKKYGDTIAEIIEYKEEMKDKREKLTSREEMIKQLQAERDSLKEEFYHHAEKLSRIRQEQARKLEDQLHEEFVDLALKETRFKVDFQKQEPSVAGIDRIEFLIATNPGEDLKPLTRVVSGGELSRIMLALKTIIADIDRVDTLIFDEIDSGVGGKTAQKMAEKLARLAMKRQILCITHLPQIASMADTHFLINKKTETDNTYTVIEKLNREEKKKELARMLGGVKTTETTMQHAEEMLKLAEDIK